MRAGSGDQPNVRDLGRRLAPGYDPPPGFPALERLAISLASGDNPRLRLECYFAFTANTLQFGAHLEVYAAKDLGVIGDFELEGHLGFDALLKFSPLSFVVEISAGLTLKRNGDCFAGVTFDMTLSGPQPWHACGTATFKILGASKSFDFDLTMGDPPPPFALAPIDPLGLLKAALEDIRSWAAGAPSAPQTLVTLRAQAPGDDRVLVHPLGSMTVRQRVVPLKFAIEQYGHQELSGNLRTFSIDSVKAGNQTLGQDDIRDHFAPGDFLKLTDDQKLARPSFESLNAGVTMGSAAIAGGARAQTNFAYKQYILTDAPNQVADHHLSPAALKALAATGPAGRAPDRTTGSARYAGDNQPVTVTDTPYAVSRKDALSAAAGVAPTGPTYSEAEAARRQADHAGDLQIVGAHEGHDRRHIEGHQPRSSPTRAAASPRGSPTSTTRRSPTSRSRTSRSRSRAAPTPPTRRSASTGPATWSRSTPSRSRARFPTPETPAWTPNYFPHVEFDRPDYPWLFSPYEASGDRLHPWLALIVVADDADTTYVERHDVSQRPALTLSPGAMATELLNLEDRWAWAHVQVAGDLAASQLDAEQSDHPEARSRAAGSSRHGGCTPTPATARASCPPTRPAERPGWARRRSQRRSSWRGRSTPRATCCRPRGSRCPSTTRGPLRPGRTATSALPAACTRLRCRSGLGERDMDATEPGGGLPSAGTGLGGLQGALMPPSASLGGGPTMVFRDDLRALLDSADPDAGAPARPLEMPPPIYARWQAGVAAVPPWPPRRRKPGWLTGSTSTRATAPRRRSGRSWPCAPPPAAADDVGVGAGRPDRPRQPGARAGPARAPPARRDLPRADRRDEVQRPPRDAVRAGTGARARRRGRPHPVRDD